MLSAHHPEESLGLVRIHFFAGGFHPARESFVDSFRGGFKPYSSSSSSRARLSGGAAFSAGVEFSGGVKFSMAAAFSVGAVPSGGAAVSEKPAGEGAEFDSVCIVINNSGIVEEKGRGRFLFLCHE